MTSEDLNAWARLDFLDPEPVLLNLRLLERELIGRDIDPRVLRLRTNALREVRESRDAALFAHGMSTILGTKVCFARYAVGDYDFVTRWIVGGTRHYCPVQLKELPPSDLNPTLTLGDLLAGLGKYGPSATALAVLLNKPAEIAGPELPPPARIFSQVWFFWLASPDGSRWKIRGDALAAPATYAFTYPGSVVVD